MTVVKRIQRPKVVGQQVALADQNAAIPYLNTFYILLNLTPRRMRKPVERDI